MSHKRAIVAVSIIVICVATSTIFVCAAFFGESLREISNYWIESLRCNDGKHEYVTYLSGKSECASIISDAGKSCAYPSECKGHCEVNDQGDGSCSRFMVPTYCIKNYSGNIVSDNLKQERCNPQYFMKDLKAGWALISSSKSQTFTLHQNQAPGRWYRHHPLLVRWFRQA